MSKSLIPLVFLTVGLTWPATSLAQDARQDTTNVRAARAVLMSDLRNVLVAQERYFAEHVTYAATMREMRQIFAPSPKVRLVILSASEQGHSEIAIHADVPDLVCGVYVGDSAPPLGVGREGQVVCRGPEATR